MKTLKIGCISDTHTKHRNLKLESVDILLFAGDSMGSGYERYELIDFLDWFNKQDARYKIFIAGNHDRYIQDYPETFKNLLKENYPELIYLENSGIEIEGIKIWGSPDQKMFCNWAFNRTQAELEDIFSKIPEDTNILLSHAPAYGIGDMCPQGHVGELTLLRKIETLDKLNLHVYGHIHEGYGKYNLLYESVNASVLDHAYRLKNEPVYIKYKI